MKTITVEELTKINYDYKNISNYKLTGNCERCKGNFEYSNVKKFLRYRKLYPQKKHLWNTCKNCWLKIQTSESPEWLEKNKNAQLVAQNKPEQIAKNALGVSKSWTKERKEKHHEWLANKWATDEKYRDRLLKNISWTQKKDSYYEVMLRRSIGSGGLKGVYNNICYDSLLELSYILWCQDYELSIKRYDLEPIDYIDENGKPRLYYPDFLVEDMIVEIKGLGLFYKINYLRNICKLEYAKKKYDKYIMYLSTDICVKKNYKRARKIHHENKEKNNDSI